MVTAAHTVHCLIPLLVLLLPVRLCPGKRILPKLDRRQGLQAGDQHTIQCTVVIWQITRFPPGTCETMLTVIVAALKEPSHRWWTCMQADTHNVTQAFTDSNNGCILSATRHI